MTEKATAVNETSAYAAIVKFEEKEDGTVLVYGKATDDTLDSDEQICDPEWLKAAMPKWFEWGNIREQHSNVAAGVATEYEAKADGHYITAHVVDPSSAKKVTSGVLKGLSIGIRRPRVIKDNKAAGGRIVDGEIVEISLVDRPANPACVLTMAKMDGGALVQVEELNEEEEVFETYPEKKSPARLADEILAEYKTLDVTLTKFDQTAFDNARVALATLIQVEAGELADGEDETHSLYCLLAAVHALFEWHEGEAAAGETNPIPELEEDVIEMSDTPDKEAMCKECGKSEKECKCAEGGFSAEMKSVEPEVPAENAPAEDAPVAPAEDVDKAASPEVSNLREMVAEILKELQTENVSEVVATKSADTQRIEALELELEQVKALAAPTGPSRLSTVSSKASDTNLQKAAEYRAKAAATEDKALAAGYLALAIEHETKTTK